MKFKHWNDYIATSPHKEVHKILMDLDVTENDIIADMRRVGKESLFTGFLKYLNHNNLKLEEETNAIRS
mgnify:CR=1 FL=1